MRHVPPKAELKIRLQKFRAVLAQNKLPGILISDDANVRYLSGFTGHDSALVITQKGKFILTDGRYTEEAQLTAPGWKIVLKPRDIMEKAATIAREQRLRALGVEPETLNMGSAARLKKFLKRIALKPVSGLVTGLRKIKSPWELKQIEHALKIQEKVFLQVVRLLRPGIREFEAAAELRHRMVLAGADEQAFECMVQFGSNASLPHGRPTDRILKEGNIVLIDWGCKYAGYHADLTRTFFVGSIPARLRKIHEIVAQAQAAAVARVGPGVPFSEVDKAARDVIRKAGYGKQFMHSTGHGIGLRIHEAPGLSFAAKGNLEPGMVVTVEPGIYLPGVGGVRLEDDVLVTAKGHRVLSRLPIGLRGNGK